MVNQTKIPHSNGFLNVCTVECLLFGLCSPAGVARSPAHFLAEKTRRQYESVTSLKDTIQLQLANRAQHSESSSLSYQSNQVMVSTAVTLIFSKSNRVNRLKPF